MRRAPVATAIPLALCFLPSTSLGQVPSKEMAQAMANYGAKVAASAIFVSGRTLESVLEQEFAPTRLIEATLNPLLKFDVDRKLLKVTCTLNQAQASAQMLPSLGCTLLYSDQFPSQPRRAFMVTTPTNQATDESALWPYSERTATAATTGIDIDAVNRAVDRAFAESNIEKRVNTRAIVVVYKGQLVAERYGEGFHKQMPLPGWSMSKTLTSALIGKRVGERQFELGAAVQLGQLSKSATANASGRTKQLVPPTCRDLLTMTAGLDWNEDYYDPSSDALRMLFGSADHAEIYRNRPQTVSAGERFQYASGATNLLCKELRKTFKHDRDYWSYPHEFFQQLRMQTAILETDPSGTFVGSSYCYASARDWARLGLLYQQDGMFLGQRVLPKGWVQQSTTPANASNGRYGYQIWLNRAANNDLDEQRKWPDLPSDLFSMDGHEGQYCVISPSAELVIVRLGCTKSGGFDLHGLLREVHEAAGITSQK